MIVRDFWKRWKFLEDHSIEVRQDPEELFEAYERIQSYEPLNFIEIGSFKGGSAYVLAGLLKQGSEIILIDKGDRGVTHVLMRTCKFLQEEGFPVHFINRLSQDEFAVKRTEDILNGSYAGLIHVDGSHNTKAILKDFSNYCPFLSENGFMLFHDVVTMRSARVAWRSHITKRAPDKYLGNPDKSKLEFSIIGGSKGRGDPWASGIGVIWKKP